MSCFERRVAEWKRELEHTQGQLDEARVEDARAKQQRERTLATGKNASRHARAPATCPLSSQAHAVSDNSHIIAVGRSGGPRLYLFVRGLLGVLPGLAHAFAPTVSAILAPRAPSGCSAPSVVSLAVWCSSSALISPPSRTIVVESQIQVMKPIAAPSEP